MGYAVRTTLNEPIDQVEERVRNALSEQGFGVLTYIDMAATLKEKIGVEIPPYRVLGACRPPLAAQALEAEADVGLLLPCNVAVYREGEQTVVAALDPATMVTLTGNERLQGVAAEAAERLDAALASLAEQP